MWFSDIFFFNFYSKLSDIFNSSFKLREKKFLNQMSLEEFWDLLLRDLDLSLQPLKKAKTLSLLTVDQLVGSIRTYEMSLPTSKKSKEIILRAFFN